MLEKLYRMDIEYLRLTCRALGIEDVLGCTRSDLLYRIFGIIAGNASVDPQAVAVAREQCPSLSAVLDELMGYVSTKGLGLMERNSLTFCEAEHDRFGKHGDLAFGYVWNNALCDEFGNALYAIQPYFMRHFELRGGTYVCGRIKREEFYELEKIEMKRAKRYVYPTHWNDVPKKSPDEFLVMPLAGLPVAKGGLTVITGPQRDRLAANLAFYLRFSEMFVVMATDKPDLRKMACWTCSASYDDTARFVYERAARRAENGLDTVVYYDNDGSLPMCPYKGASESVGSISVIVTSDKPLAEQDTLIVTREGEFGPDAIDVERSYSTLATDPDFPLMRWITDFRKTRWVEPWRELNYILCKQKNKK